MYLCFDSYVLRLLGDPDTARLLGKRLAKMQRERGLDERDILLCDFIAGDCDATSMLAVTGKSRRFDCSAYLALGVDALADGRREDAAKYFRSGERTDYFSFYDHLLNRAFAERLESGQPWLEWIPDKSGTGTSGSRSVQKQE